jgi:hypothetical protein
LRAILNGEIERNLDRLESETAEGEENHGPGSAQRARAIVQASAVLDRLVVSVAEDDDDVRDETQDQRDCDAVDRMSSF